MHERLTRVSRGFWKAFLGLVIEVVGVVVSMLAVFALFNAASSAGRGNLDAMDRQVGWVKALAVVSLLLSLVGVIVGLHGRILCLSVPGDAADAKPMIYASVGLQLAGLSFSLLNQLDTLTGGFLGGGTKTIVTGVAFVLPIVAGILFLLFAQSVAHFVRQPGLGQDAGKVLTLWVCTIACYAIAIVLVLALRGIGACIAGPLSLVGLGLLIWSVIKYAAVLTAMASAVSDYADESQLRTRRKKKSKRVVTEETEDVEGEDAS